MKLIELQIFLIIKASTCFSLSFPNSCNSSWAEETCDLNEFNEKGLCRDWCSFMTTETHEKLLKNQMPCPLTSDFEIINTMKRYSQQMFQNAKRIVIIPALKQKPTKASRDDGIKNMDYVMKKMEILTSPQPLTSVPEVTTCIHPTEQKPKVIGSIPLDKKATSETLNKFNADNADNIITRPSISQHWQGHIRSSKVAVLKNIESDLSTFKPATTPYA